MELGIVNSQQEQEIARSLRSRELSPTKATETWPTLNLFPFSSSPEAPWGRGLGWRGKSTVGSSKCVGHVARVTTKTVASLETQE